MKSKLETYTFSKQEIKILKEIVSENHILSSLRKTLSIKPNLLSHYLKRLQKKNIVEFQKRSFSSTEKNEKSKKYVYFSNSKHALSLRELLLAYNHIEWEDILSGLGIEVLFQILADYHITFESFSSVTFWRYSKNFMARGLVECDRDVFRINPRFSILVDFLKEYQQFIISSVVKSLSESAVTLWQKDLECLIRIPKNLEVTQRGFQKTATSRLPDFGIQLLSDFDVYFYSRRRKIVRTEDIILHTLLVERDNIRYVTYSLLLLEKELRKIDKEYLLKEAAWLDLRLQINAMFQFLETKGARKGLALPTWTEFMAKAKDYGVLL